MQGTEKGSLIDFNSIFSELKNNHPNITFQKSDHSRWSPETKTIHYKVSGKNSLWSLLHEIGHMVCDHTTYDSDIGLLRMEVAAWKQAREIASRFNVVIDEEHIQKCLDTYRDWVYKRSSCPVCTQAGIEKELGLYSCINCPSKWKVSSARFCRPYRKTVTA